MRQSHQFVTGIAFVCIVVFGLSGIAQSAGPIGHDGTLSKPQEAGRSDFIDGLNPDVAVDDERFYTMPWFALPYTPDISFCIDRAEFIHGEATGTITIQVRTDEAGLPSNVVLTQGTHELLEPVGFQGADMPPVSLSAGTQYWIVFQVPVGSQASVGLRDDGDLVVYYFSEDAMNWEGGGIYYEEVWIARFYGVLGASPVENTTWGAIKGMHK